MVSDRTRQRIERLLDEAEAAVDQEDWETVRSCARRILAFDPDNRDALDLVQAADRAKAGGEVWPSGDEGEASLTSSIPHFLTSSVPTSFVGGRYQVIRFLGEGGKKRVYLAHDTLLDRDVAFALIKTEGLDDEGRERITREAQAMGKLGDHPHIVPVFDMGEEPSGGAQALLPVPRGGAAQPYIVTQFMPGGDVEGLLERYRDGPGLGWLRNRDARTGLETGPVSLVSGHRPGFGRRAG